MNYVYLVLILLLTYIHADTQWIHKPYTNNENIKKTLCINGAETLYIQIIGETEAYYDFIYLYNSTGDQIAKLHGNINQDLQIDDACIDLHFKSDFSITKEGVSVMIYESNPMTTWKIKNYSNNSDISKTLSIPNAYKLKVTVLGDIEQFYDFLSFYDENGNQVKRLHGSINESFIMHGSSINVHFKSDFSITQTGFEVKIEAIKDITKPVITLNGAPYIELIQNSTYTDLGAQAYDNYDGNITKNIQIKNMVNTATTGTYKITYNVSDVSGNSANEVTRTVVVLPEPDENKVFAFYADEHNPDFTIEEGNKVIQIDIKNMKISDTLEVPGIFAHHIDNGFNSKLYSVPKKSNYVSVVTLRKDIQGNAKMHLTKKISLNHRPRSGDAYNKEYNIIFMVADNRPMGSFINVETDEVMGTVGEEIDCILPDGSMLLSHADANTAQGALKYECALDSNIFGGTQVSGHPYWLTRDIVALIDRANNKIWVYHIQINNDKVISTLMNHVDLKTSVHQIVPRDRSTLPLLEQSDFYAIEEGRLANNNLTDGIPHALLHLKLTENGLILVRRMNLAREKNFSETTNRNILNSCLTIYVQTLEEAYNTGKPVMEREERYNNLFMLYGISRNPDQDPYNDLPVDCFYPGIPGGHNADFAPNNKHLYIGMAGGAMSIVDVTRWKLANNIDVGYATGPGHTCFSEKNNVAIISTHNFTPNFENERHAISRTIKDINSERPTTYYWIQNPFEREYLTDTATSHSCYVDDSGDYYYNFFTDGGVFYKIDLSGVYDNPENGSSDLIIDSIYTGGIPIQGTYMKLKDIYQGEL